MNPIEELANFSPAKSFEWNGAAPTATTCVALWRILRVFVVLGYQNGSTS